MADSRFFCGGDLSRNQLLPYLKEACRRADHIDVAVSFVRFSGVKLLLEALKDADRRNIPIQLVCGNYLGITEPAALSCLVNELSNNVELCLYTDPSRSFHPKCWIFSMEDETQVLIGSSNISRSALTSGIEWNYVFSSRQDERSTKNILREFEQLFKDSLPLNENRIEAYRKTWERPVLHGIDHEDVVVAESAAFTPNEVQQEALYALEKSRDNGCDKALIQAATGTGKTFLAAFDSKSYERVLFVAHRKEILIQAAHTFSLIDPKRKISFVMDGVKNADADAVFASVQTFGSEEFLKNIEPDAFDYIVVDEFHHAAAGRYANILNHFKPKFLLGLTATPYRLDGKDIYALCDYNVPYRIDLFQAILQGFLVPFHYYGIYDETDYRNVRMRGMKFNEHDLDDLYVDNQNRANLIFRHYKKYGCRKTLAFCSSMAHAKYMARYFQDHGVKAVAVVSGKSDMDRDEALDTLRNGQLEVIFSVDMFNEGVDVPSIDMVMFLRPTESAVIYLQQLGRGLRKAPGKPYLTVLDFIGNHRSAMLGPSLVTNEAQAQMRIASNTLPNGCFVDFDLKLIDVFEKIQRLQTSRADRIIRLWKNAKDELGHAPSRTEFFRSLDPDEVNFIFADSSRNPFRNYRNFLKQMGEPASDDASAFIRFLETTSMSKVYKMPVLMAFIDKETRTLRKRITDKQALEVWKEFFSRNGRWIDLADTYEEFKAISDKRHLTNIRNNPVRFLEKSGKEFFHKADDALLELDESLWPYLDNEAVVNSVIDILDMRSERYFSHRYEQKEA